MSKRRFSSAHFLAALAGGLGLLAQLAFQTTATYVYVVPIVSAALVVFAFSRLLPLWFLGTLFVGCAVFTFVHAHGIDARRRARAEAMRLDFAIADVCDGKPLGRDPNGAKLRVLNKRDDSKYWIGENVWPAGKIPTYTLCVTHTNIDVQCGMYTEQGGRSGQSDAPTKICTQQDSGTVNLRLTKTAEVVFTKSYTGAAPKQLESTVQLGGPGSTQLRAGDIAYSPIYDDIKPFLDRAK
jgi:hypothetical protein